MFETERLNVAETLLSKSKAFTAVVPIAQSLLADLVPSVLYNYSSWTNLCQLSKSSQLREVAAVFWVRFNERFATSQGEFLVDTPTAILKEYVSRSYGFILLDNAG